MLKKIRLLIVASVLGLLALSLVQGYLINNTYKLEKEAFISESRKSISRIDDLSPELDVIDDDLQEYFLNLIADYYVKKITKQQVLEKLKLKTGTVNNAYIKDYNKEIAKKNIASNLKFQIIAKTIIVLDSVKNDTIFKSIKKPPFHLLGYRFALADSYKVNNSLSVIEHKFQRKINGKQESIAFSVQFETEGRMNIDGWKKIVIKRMSSLLMLSVFIFLFVFGLLFYSIKNLIIQKKIADIKTDFVNNITHELKTPLATLTLATKMLKKKELILKSSIIETTVNTIERQNIRLQKLIDQVLNNSLRYQKIKLTKELVNTKDYLEMIIDDFQLSLDSKSIKIDKNMETNTAVFIDKFYYTTAILNILENAVKYGKEDVEIKISAKTDKNFTVSISDNGIGIPKKQQPFLFDKFYRVGNKEVHNVKGLGLGLYYTHQIIKAHQGTISVESKENSGSKFTIQIPLK
ncbi:MAG: sensor histidine kinase [Polaribacter sp.]